MMLQISIKVVIYLFIIEQKRGASLEAKRKSEANTCLPPSIKK
ncbi:hypothetical protein LINGRAHAP2_LOCUS27879 [Linum grandiflorum]